MLKTKKSVKKIKVVSKGLKEKSLSLTPIQEKLKKAKLPYTRGRILKLVEFFNKHKIIEGKVYNAVNVYGTDISSVPQIGSKGRDYLKQFKGYHCQCVEKGTHDNVYKTFKLFRIKK